MFCKTLVLVFALAFAIQALPQIALKKIEAQNTILAKLGLLPTVSDESSVNYNEYILNLEAVVEQVQKVALYAIQSAVEIGELVAKTLATLGAHQNVMEIHNLQNTFFRMFEDVRYKAFDKDIDISDCVSPAIQLVHDQSQNAIDAINGTLGIMVDIFTNLTRVTYIEPAQENLAKSYTIRERIYTCPFNSTSFMPFYACLAVVSVIDDIVTIQEFADKFNDTATEVTSLVGKFQTAVNYYRQLNVQDFNNTAQKIYDNTFLPCASDKGYTP